MSDSVGRGDPLYQAFKTLETHHKPGHHNWRTFRPFRRLDEEAEDRFYGLVQNAPQKQLNRNAPHTRLREWDDYCAAVEEYENEQEARAAMSTATPGPRRSSRVASRDATPAAPGAYAESVSARTRRASATPAPVTTPARGGRRGARTGASPAAAGASNATLPPVSSTTSFAYGASGRASVADPREMRATGATTTTALQGAVNTAFTADDIVSGRQSSVAPRPAPIEEEREEESEDEIPPPPLGRSSTSPSRQSSVVPPSERGSSIPRDFADDDDTNVDASRSFGMQHEAGAVPPHGLQFARPTRPQVWKRWIAHKYVGLRDWVDDHLPSPPTLFLVGILCAYIFALCIGKELPQPDGRSFNEAKESLYNSIGHAAQVTTDAWRNMRHDGAQFGRLDSELQDQRKRYGALNDQYNDLYGRYSSITAELEEIRSILPDLTVVRKNEDGTVELLDHFWSALENKVAGEPSKGIFEKWFGRNQEIVTEVQKSLTTEDYNAIMAWGLKQYQLISKDEVLKILEEHYQDYDAKYARYDDKFNQIRDYSIESATERYLAQHHKGTQHKLVEGAWAQKTIENARLALESPNFMSPKLGAAIDPYLTSPTAKKSYNSWQHWLYGKLEAPKPNPPIVALTGWDEAGDCWCSAHSEADAGKAQLAVMLMQPVYASHIVIDHIPKAGTLNPGSAPKEIEVWVQVKSETVREALKAQLSVASWGGSCNTEGSMPEDFVCVAAPRYDLHHWNHVQMSRLEVDFKTLGIPVGKVIVRVQSTWGDSKVCLYRVRLLGEPA